MPEPKMPEPLHVVGRSVPRSDAASHVSGRTRFAGDYTFPGMLHLKMVRSPVHHAMIRGVDLSGAERVPGFVRALTWRDVPHNVYTILGLIGVEPEEEFVLSQDRVRYKGEPIVAIVAETEAAALEAVSEVRLDLEELPAVFDVEEALQAGAPIVTHWGSNAFMFEGHPSRRVRFGDVEAGFAQAGEYAGNLGEPGIEAIRPWVHVVERHQITRRDPAENAPGQPTEPAIGEVERADPKGHAAEPEPAQHRRESRVGDPDRRAEDHRRDALTGQDFLAVSHLALKSLRAPQHEQRIMRP